jgi:hypothetical protein
MIYSQEKTASIKPKTPEAVYSYMNLLDSLTVNANNRISKLSKASTVTKETFLEPIGVKGLKLVARIMYNAYDSDFMATQNSLLTRSEEIKNSKSNSETKPRTPIIIQGLLWDQIKNSISATVEGLVEVAYFLKIRINSVKIISHTMDNGMPVPVTINNGTIETVYKGNTTFKTGDNIDFYYYNNWVHKSINFEIGKEYFIPIEPRGKFLNYVNALALVVYLDKSEGYFPIDNGYLIDAHNFFGFGEKLDYRTFEQSLKNKIEEIKSW